MHQACGDLRDRRWEVEAVVSQSLNTSAQLLKVQRSALTIKEVRNSQCAAAYSETGRLHKGKTSPDISNHWTTGNVGEIQQPVIDLAMRSSDSVTHVSCYGRALERH